MVDSKCSLKDVLSLRLLVLVLILHLLFIMYNTRTYEYANLHDSLFGAMEISTYGVFLNRLHYTTCCNVQHLPADKKCQN